MSFSAPVDPHQSMKAQLAYTLRALRTVKGLSQNQLAKELYATREAIAAYETGRNRPDVEFCERLDEFFGTGEMFQSLWGHAQHEHLREWFEAYIGHETEASQIRTFQSMYVPGLLQTEGYMRASADDPQLLEESIERRLARRDVLTRDDAPPAFFAVLDEAVIRRPVGGAKVMKEQLQHLLDMGERPNVFIRVVQERTGWYRGMDGALVVLTKPDRTIIGYAEAHFGGRLMENPAEVVNLTLRFDQIGVKALSEDASGALILNTLETMRDDSMAEE
jgi:transcriptional regulator with XRE-family HTH domain